MPQPTLTYTTQPNHGILQIVSLNGTIFVSIFMCPCTFQTYISYTYHILVNRLYLSMHMFSYLGISFYYNKYAVYVRSSSARTIFNSRKDLYIRVGIIERINNIESYISSDIGRNNGIYRLTGGKKKKKEEGEEIFHNTLILRPRYRRFEKPLKK